MSTNESTSSRGTLSRSRSRSRSRSPTYNNGRFPPRYSSRYESYTYRPRSGMTAAIDDYWELRDRGRDRERERDRSMVMIRDERYMRGRRYSPYYRDEPPPPHHYGPSRDYGKPSSLSSSTSLRRENSHERTSVQSTKPKDDSSISGSSNKPTTATTPTFDNYPSRYSDWREREWDRDRDRDRRYRDEDRRREFDRRNRDRDSYGVRDPRYDSPGYAGGPSTLNYHPPPFGRDSYRPGGREREPSSPGTHSYYDRDSRDRFDDRDLYRPVSSRGSSIDLDQYRNSRVFRPVIENSGSIGAGVNDRNITGWRASGHDRERDNSGNSILGTGGPTSYSSSSSSSSSSKDGNNALDAKVDDIIGTGDQNSGPTSSDDTGKSSTAYTILTEIHSVTPPDKDNGDCEVEDSELPRNVEQHEDLTTVLAQQNQHEGPTTILSQQNQKNKSTMKPTPLRIDISLPSKSSFNDFMDMEVPKPTSSSSPNASSRSAAISALSSISSSPSTSLPPASSKLVPTPLASTAPPVDPNEQPSSPSSSSSSSSPPLISLAEGTAEPLVVSLSAKKHDVVKPEPFPEPPTMTAAKVNLETDTSPLVTSTLHFGGLTYRNSSTPISTDDTKENLEPNTGNQINSGPVMSQQQIVARIDEIENSITKYEEMLEQVSKREATSKHIEQQQKEDWQQQSEGSSSPIETKDNDNGIKQETATAKTLALQAISGICQPLTDIQNSSCNDSSIMRRRPQILVDQIRIDNDTIDNTLADMIISTNRNLAMENSRLVGGWQGNPTQEDDWLVETKWMAPLYGKLQDYPCYKENIATFSKLKATMVSCLASRERQLKHKERRLKREFKEIYNQWKNKNMALDRTRIQERQGLDRYGGSGSSNGYRSSTRRNRGPEEESDEYIDGVIFTGNHSALQFGTDGAMTPFGRASGKGGWTSDAARSEAELLEIIQSLESAEMRNPELRAAKTTATIPPMILDAKLRAQTYDDRSGLVQNPLVYYHTGTETEDLWNQQEMTAFMESYMQYPKQFDKVSAAVQTKTASQCVLFYYRKKTKIDFKALMRKGKRGKSRRRERLAAAIKRATGDTSTNTRTGKNKGSALMADIGQAQVSRKAKEKKESETKSKELRELEEANAYWEGVAERRRAKRPTSNPATTSRTNDVNDDYGSTVSGDYAMKRRLGKRKGRSPRFSVANIPDSGLVFPDDETTVSTTAAAPTAAPVASKSKSFKHTHQIQSMERSHSHHDMRGSMNSGVDEHESNPANVATAKWTNHDKLTAVEAFKLLGRDFVKVSEMLGNKTDDQCRNFYFNHKRKFGSNAFGEEASDYSGNSGATSPSTSTSNPKINTSRQSFNMATATRNERSDLKAEEEDAAATLVGLFEMGGNRDHSGGATPSSALSSPSVSFLTGETAPTQPSKHMAILQQPQQSKGRRRARTTSGKMDITATSGSWTGGDLGMAVHENNAGIGKWTTPDIKRGTNSSYWSVSERSEFNKCLELYGRDWTKIANALTTKTMVQVRNFYHNNEEKLRLDKVALRRESIRSLPTESLLGSPHNNSNRSSSKLEMDQQRIMPPMGTSFDNRIPSSSIYLQPEPIPTLSSPQPSYDAPPPMLSHHSSYGQQAESASYHSLATGPRAGYFNPSSSSAATKFTQPGARDRPPYSSINTSYYPENYSNSNISNISDHTAISPPPHRQRPQSAPTKRRNVLDVTLATSPTGVTRVSDLLNSNDEPAETNNQNSWETWFGS
ncbi:hypothetical protein BCR42DRAFT_25672 [Absidia repens]|uniref:SANT domain-containing protein n=1 Tax=Absidia repens TaxID=90262 RepID=A0A1X2IIG4_9FUNG|nr:hypothetical protein BCR42DRAFT_25672 [Absidia repens]